MSEPTFRAIPVLRIFDLAKAKEFYRDFLGFRIDWEHRFEDAAPVYLQIARGDLVLHLSEHHGDGSPGACVYVRTSGLEDFHREIAAKSYRFMRPGTERTPWGSRLMEVIDPFGNRLRFDENPARSQGDG
jgi:catechol 2,3-dioxygenase-like lactoylglutathione lyase family enzyme